MALVDVPVTTLQPDRFRGVLTAGGLARFEHTIARGRELLADRTFWTVNSTANGGGVAEMLRSLVGYVRGAGHGHAVGRHGRRRRVLPRHQAAAQPPPRRRRRAAARAGRTRPRTSAPAPAMPTRWPPGSSPADVILLHDPQTAGMIPRLLETGVPVIWRAHIGLDLPNEAAREAWRFLLPYVVRANAYVFSRPAYAWEGLDPELVTVIAPSIDAFSPKNQNMSFTSVTAVLRAAGLAADHHHPARAVFERLDGTTAPVSRAARMIEEHALRLDTPLVAQVSRWDRLKDPVGVLSGFAEHVHLEHEEPHLVLAGPDVAAVADDPEGAEVLAEVEAVWHSLPRAVRRRVHLALLPMEDADENAAIVNALQRRADVVVQKSLAEGFGLTVAEGMWKGRPVVASRVGGIQDQIEDGVTGLLVAPTDLAAFGERVSELLADPHAAERMGEAAQVRVRDFFLGPRHLGEYVDLLERVLARA